MQSVFQPGDRRTERASAFRRHPAYESPRERDRAAYLDDLDRDLTAFTTLRDRLATARIIESGWPC
jgi:hypothetical protein